MTAVKLKVKKGDKVIVRTGRDKGKIGTVLKVLKEDSALIVEGVNVVKKHVKPTQYSAGGIEQKESKIHVSNVALLDPKTEQPSKVGFKIQKDGSKVRFAKKSGEII
ncbi:50S ribosomal protein L24 [Candidatus Odyssella acanthamoebae]|uniref:Large ribosomal subunit protein uL24 n=1 Tax=Candidatus Odyssella acanthamoebae TaxID=91604 RepID=A0A077AWE1_9PROT|nr:50S ribosomal protein L24 [Candidatus Paracaedibacter acanthamoebae]AIK96756.1 50S ribosomal protein L24 [Candidatus Paracaedibacter acanthamoebae]MBW8308140.1 50S ribosomal protein L24 [Candidatus Paracaedibacteraceae bacterium]